MDTVEIDIDLLGHFIHAMRGTLRVAVIRTREVANESHPSRAKQKAALAYAACHDAEATLKKAQFLWEMKTRSRQPTKERVSLRALADTISQTVDILGEISSNKNSVVLGRLLKKSMTHKHSPAIPPTSWWCVHTRPTRRQRRPALNPTNAVGGSFISDLSEGARKVNPSRS
jgi:hypothetical protein